VAAARPKTRVAVTFHPHHLPPKRKNIMAFQPVTIESKPEAWKKWALSEERTTVFSVTRAPVDENDEPIIDAEPELIAYTMPAKPNPGLALKFLKMARESGELASSWLIEEAIGSEGYDDLAEELINYDGDAAELLGQIVQKIQKVAMGGLETPKA
jgi:hypothetical protein